MLRGTSILSDMKTVTDSVSRLHVLSDPKAYIPNHYPVLSGSQPTAPFLVLRTTAISLSIEDGELVT